MKLKNIITLLFSGFLFIQILAQENEQSIPIQYLSVTEMAHLDSLSAQLFYKDEWFESDSLVKAKIYTPRHELPQYSDEELLEMTRNLPFAFDMSYNNVVKASIEQFAYSRRLFIAKGMGLGEAYFPYIEEVLDREGMPDEIKYLPVIESLMDPSAKSHMGAAGLWQFMLRTGKSYGLDVNSFYDERNDPLLSTDAAAAYLQDLYNIYDDWQLAIAAYNAGPGNVNKAIAKAGGSRSYWDIRPYLPKETQKYVPLYLGCAFVIHYHEKFDILPLQPLEEIFYTDTIRIYEKVSLEHIANNLNIDATYLALINPSLKTNVIPKSEEGFVMQLPYDYLAQFVALETFILNDPTLEKIEAEVVTEAETDYIVYKVKSGDTLGHIAERYNTSVANIRKWNNLRNDFLNIGQKLTIHN